MTPAKFVVCASLQLFFLLLLQSPVSGKPKVDPLQIKKVHIVFMNHLDVGYDGIYPTVGFALNVINKYFTEYYPRAVNVGAFLRVFGYSERLKYTTHPWLLYLYLHCTNFTLASNVTLQCPNKTEVANMRKSILMGDVVWHAGPMNMQYEFMEPHLMEMSLNISHHLDLEFGIQRRAAVVSQRDVPGMTKAVIPFLKKYNIAAVSVGVNDMTSPPAVPDSPFIWKLNEDDEDGIIGLWHPGGYPDNAGAYPVAAGGMSVRDCVFAQDVIAFPETLCFAFRTDNSGPPMDASEVLKDFELARGQFPNAEVVASTMEDFVDALKSSSTSFPTISDEIGDTWIMGIQSDPKKVAMYRAFTRVLANCLDTGKCQPDDPRITQAAFYAVKIPEHTWGLDSVNDFKNWSNADFAKARSGKGYTNCEAGWKEQRQFLDLAMSSLGSHPVATSIQAEYLDLIPSLPDLTNYATADITKQYTCADGTILQFAFDGSLNRLYDPYNKIEWASASATIGQLMYSTYNESDYDYMSKLYDFHGGAGFHKSNSTLNAHPDSRNWPLVAKQLYIRKGALSCDFIVSVVPLDQESISKYGAPPVFYVQFKSLGGAASSPNAGLQIVVQWFNKGPTRLSESISFGFSPRIRKDRQWMMSKMGVIIDPLNVLLNGSQYLHAINEGVYYTDKNINGLEILSQDVALLLLGTPPRPPSVLPVPLTPITQSINSAAFNLYNNFWNTNYIYWYPYFNQDKDFKARFYLNFI